MDPTSHYWKGKMQRKRKGWNPTLPFWAMLAMT
jgi:hypothetical protein